MILLATAMAAAAAAQPVPKPIGPPSAWVRAADYPPAAILAGEEGIVGFRLGVDEQGRTVACTITQSSGSALLDGTTCRLMTLRARFQPAKDAEGKAVASAFQSRTKWVIPQFRPPSPGLLVTTVSVSPNGTVEKCTAQASGDVPPMAEDMSCHALAQPAQALMLKSQAVTYKTLRSAIAVSVGARKYTIDGSGWGTLILRRAHEMEMSPTGKPLRCTAIASVGGNLADDPCVRLRKLMTVPASAEKPAHVMSFDTVIYGEKR